MTALIPACTQLLRWLSEPPSTGLPAVAQYEAPALTNLGVGLVWSARIDEAEEPAPCFTWRRYRHGAALRRG